MNKRKVIGLIFLCICICGLCACQKENEERVDNDIQIEEKSQKGNKNKTINFEGKADENLKGDLYVFWKEMNNELEKIYNDGCEDGSIYSNAEFTEEMYKKYAQKFESIVKAKGYTFTYDWGNGYWNLRAEKSINNGNKYTVEFEREPSGFSTIINLKPEISGNDAEKNINAFCDEVNDLFGIKISEGIIDENIDAVKKKKASENRNMYNFTDEKDRIQAKVSAVLGVNGKGIIEGILLNIDNY